MDTAEKIKYLRVKVLHQPQTIFASNIGVTVTTIKNWETGLSKPTVSHLLMISMIASVTLDYLIFDDIPEQLSLYELSDKQYEILKNLIDYFRNN